MNIPYLALSARAASALNRARITTVEQLLATPLKTLMRLRNFGPKCATELFAVITSLGHRHPDDGMPTERKKIESAIRALEHRIKALKKLSSVLMKSEMKKEKDVARWEENRAKDEADYKRWVADGIAKSKIETPDANLT